jgi:hypothetical protein
VWFDDAPITRTNLLPKTLVQELVSDLEALLSISTYQNALDQLGLAIPGGGTVEAVVNRLSHLDLTGAFDATGLRNIDSIPALETFSVKALEAGGRTLEDDLTTVKNSFNQIVGTFTGTVGSFTLAGMDTEIQTAGGTFLSTLQKSFTGAVQNVEEVTAADLAAAVTAFTQAMSGVQAQISSVESQLQANATAIGNTFIDDVQRISAAFSNLW